MSIYEIVVEIFQSGRTDGHPWSCAACLAYKKRDATFSKNLKHSEELIGAISLHYRLSCVQFDQFCNYPFLTAKNTADIR